VARSRYSSTPLIDGRSYATWRPATAPDQGLLDGLRVEERVFGAGDRLDRLAFSYYNDEGYWWVIALANGVLWPLGIAPGTKLLVPLDLAEFLRRVLR
jgi:hypothetical protein